jgi:fructose-1,6-bisphosphatase/inositol monophosphatase family enzyme
VLGDTPWDHAPGCLLLSEAGGVAVRPDGSDDGPRDDGEGLLAAADRRTAAAALADLGLARV